MSEKMKMITDPVVGSLISFLLEGTLSGIKRVVKSHKDEVKLLTKDSDIENNIITEVKKGYNWASADLFPNHINSFNIFKRYVHLDLLLEPRRNHTSENQLKNKLPLERILIESNNNIVILGQPGSGKTTSVKYIINSILLDEHFLKGVYAIPIVIRLRELNRENSILSENQIGGIYKKLAQIFGLTFKFKDPENKLNIQKSEEELLSKLIPNILENQKILLILDGFDELTNEFTRDLVIEEIKDLSKSLNIVNFLITSRGADFKIKVENTQIYEITELTDPQINEFSDKWFENDQLARTFVEELKRKTPHSDFYRRPLLLTHLASIFSKSQEIPDKPKLIYQTIIELVLKEWNEIQGVKRKSKYASFTVSRKREFLASLAFFLTIIYNKAVFSSREIGDIYGFVNSKFSELPLEEVDEVIQEIESHNGIILKSGYDSFEFSHLTIQEYLVADYIIRGGSIRLDKSDLIKIPYELAVAVSLSSEPSKFLYDLLVDKIFKKDLEMDFLFKFCERLEIEKPDFDIGPILPIALLTIYTKLANKDGVDQVSLIHKSNLEQLIITLLPSGFIEGIKDYYVIDNDKYKSKQNFNYIGLRKQKDVVNNLEYYNFPKYLLWSKERYEKEIG